MITYKRFSTIRTNEKLKMTEYKDPQPKTSPYIVDDSYFQPVAEALKNLKNGSLTSTEIQTYYDFPNGRDDGSSVPINRRHDMKDITEISNAIISEAKEIAEKKEKLLNKLASQKAVEDFAKKSSQVKVDSPIIFYPPRNWVK